jgi:hypothetical protein
VNINWSCSPTGAAGRGRPREAATESWSAAHDSRMTNQSIELDTSQWHARDYRSPMPAAGMLSEAGVAPLVALARGYRALTGEEAPAFGKEHCIGRTTTLVFRKLTRLTAREDVTTVPWYRADHRASNWATGDSRAASAIQIIPVSPLIDATTGRIRKSEVLHGNPGTLDAHPAIPREWFTEAPSVVVLPDVLMADCALTAMLRSEGRTVDELSVRDGELESQALVRLAAYLMRVEPSTRMLMLALAPEFTQRNRSFGAMPLAGRRLILAVDAHVDADWKAWRHIQSLRNEAMNGRADVSVLDHGAIPSSVQAADGTPRLASFFANTPWTTVLGRASAHFPVPPAKQERDFEIGDWVVDPDGDGVTEYVQRLNASGEAVELVSKVRSRIGGRVESIETHRSPTDREIETARTGEDVDDSAVGIRTCRVLLWWTADDGTTATATVRGPAAILGEKPHDWHRFGAQIPANLLLNSHWPPPRLTGAKWLKAVKANNAHPAREQIRWLTMGWVPVQGADVCAFISGKTVLALSDEARESTLAGVSEVVLPGSSGFSLPETLEQFGSEAWSERVRQDLSALIDNLVLKSPWSDPNLAALIIGSALRSTVPIPSRTSLYFQGPPGHGKSDSAAFVMMFHQARAHWTGKNLPGSMKDTATAGEQAIAQTNVWVIDDLAPSPDHQDYKHQQVRAGELIRSVHNGAGKRRSGVDLRAREVFQPRSMLIFTAENALTIQSVRDRTITVHFDHASLYSENVRSAHDYRQFDRGPARITVACVQAIQNLASEISWAGLQAHLDGMRRSYTKVATRELSRENPHARVITRHVEMAVDVMMGFAPLALVSALVGDEDAAALFGIKTSAGLPTRVARLVANSFSSAAEMTPGSNTVHALRAVLSARHGYIENATDPGKPPLPASDNANSALGWISQGDGIWQPRANAVAVGHLISARSGLAEDVILFDLSNSFNLVQKHHPGLIPAGTSAKSVFGSLWAEGLVHEHFRKRGPEAGRQTVNIFRKLNFKGVPVHLESILSEE